MGESHGGCPRPLNLAPRLEVGELSSTLPRFLVLGGLLGGKGRERAGRAGVDGPGKPLNTLRSGLHVGLEALTPRVLRADWGLEVGLARLGRRTARWGALGPPSPVSITFRTQN